MDATVSHSKKISCLPIYRESSRARLGSIDISQPTASRVRERDGVGTLVLNCSHSPLRGSRFCQRCRAAAADAGPSSLVAIDAKKEVDALKAEAAAAAAAAAGRCGE